MGPARRFLEWARDNMREAEAYGAAIDLFVLPEDAELMLLQAACGEGLSEDEYLICESGTYLAGVKILWTDKVPHGQSWFRYRGGKT